MSKTRDVKRKTREARYHLELVARRRALWELVWRETHKDDKDPRPMPRLIDGRIHEDLIELVE